MNNSKSIDDLMTDKKIYEEWLQNDVSEFKEKWKTRAGTFLFYYGISLGGTVAIYSLGHFTETMDYLRPIARLFNVGGTIISTLVNFEAWKDTNNNATLFDIIYRKKKLYTINKNISYLNKISEHEESK